MKKTHIILLVALLIMPMAVQSQTNRQKLRRAILLSENMQQLAAQAVYYINNCDTLFTKDECASLAYSRVDTALRLTRQFHAISNSMRASHFPRVQTSQKAWELEDFLYDMQNLSSQGIAEFEGSERYFKKYFAVKGKNAYYSKESYQQIIYQKLLFASEKVKFCNDISMELYKVFYQ